MKKVQKSILISFIILSIISSLFLSGCKSQTLFNKGEGNYVEKASFSPDEAIKDTTFGSEEEFENFMKSYSSSGNYRSYDGFGGVMLDMIEGMPMVKSESMGFNEGSYEVDSSNEFSETNNQVLGVDEADIIKTDGDYIYTVSGNTLFIVKAYPGEDAEVVSKTSFDNMPTSLFVNGDYLAVFGNYYNNDFFKEMDFTPRQGMTYFNIYNIVDKNNPELLKEYKFEGNYFQARMIEDYVYFVTRSGMFYSGPSPMPIFIDGAEVKHMELRDIHYYPIPYQYPELANIHSIKLTSPDEDISSKSIVVEGSQNMYMSENNMFITYTEYINEWDIRQEIVVDLITPMLTSSDQELVDKIKSTDNDVLTQYEKEQKIYNIIQSYVNYMTQEERDNFEEEVESILEEKLEEYQHREFTLIHKISVDNGNIAISANGKVPGHVINQFSMDEYDNVFRIATTLNPVWSSYGKESTESTNNVFTLDDDLEILDGLTGLAEDESIYSTRFIAERLYMVTFKQVDPFFVIDLSDVENIESLGELKIPGFSRYLHPYDENTIIGIGRDATSSGRTQGLKISLFDVSDVSNPEEVAQFVTEENHAQSTAEYEHKAFLFNKEKELLVIPAYNHNYYWRNEGGQSYNGAMVFKITKEDIELRGIVDHSQGNEYYGSMVERNLFIEELLYTKSPSLLRINTIEDLSSVKSIELVSDDGPIPIY
ncbi:MAG: beta-propeller domain-containing protein [Nanoarchaeota archaeon]|nr:beta-propeller domain-containing protein [Nanoarchaeota archaeon]